MPDNNEYAPTTWGQTFTDIVTPSGQRCQIRKLQMEDLVELDIVDLIDSLGPKVQNEVVDPVRRPQDHKKKQPTKKQAAAKQAEEENRWWNEVRKDKEKFRQMSTAVDKAVWAAVMQPKLTLPFERQADGSLRKLPYNERAQGAIYTDSISFEDKMFIFNTSFSGVKKLETFRDESGEDVGVVAELPESAEDAE